MGVCYNGVQYCGGPPLAAPSLTCPGNQTAVVGGTVNLSFSNSGGQPDTQQDTNLPPGLTVNWTAGTITGTVTTAGTYNVSLYLSNTAGNDTCNFTFTVTAALAAPNISCPANDNATVGTAESYAVSNSGGAVPNGGWTATGLPPGMSINANTGAITGTPTTAGTYNISVTATNATAPASTCSFTVTVGTACIPAAAPSSAFSDSVTEGVGFATPTHGSWIGTGPITLTASGLPSWATFNPSGGSYTITGTAPTVTSDTTYTYSVTGTNACNTGGSTLSGNTLTVTNSGGGGGGGCFIEGTMVKIPDTRLKDIKDVQVGDYVVDTNGDTQLVTGKHELLYAGQLLSINGSKHFVTEGHAFLTSDGNWVAFNPEISMRETGLDAVGKLEEGAVLQTEAGEVTVSSIGLKSISYDDNVIVYNIMVEKTHTFVADNWHVHNSTQKH